MTTEARLVVVVDDDASMGQALSRLLSAAGFRARVFASAEALRASGCAAEARCLVLDLQLPGESGADCYVAMPATRPPAVFITARDVPESLRLAVRSGASGFLAKPFDGAEFLATVERAIDADPRGR